MHRPSGIHSSLETSSELLCLRIRHLVISAKLSKTDLGINDLDYMQWRMGHRAPHRIYLRFVNNASDENNVQYVYMCIDRLYHMSKMNAVRDRIKHMENSLSVAVPAHTSRVMDNMPPMYERASIQLDAMGPDGYSRVPVERDFVVAAPKPHKKTETNGKIKFKKRQNYGRGGQRNYRLM